MNENLAIPFTLKHENLFLKHSSEIDEVKSDVKVLKIDVKVLRSDVEGLKGSMHRLEILHEEMSGNINKILEVVKHNHDKYEREIPEIKEKFENHDYRISAIESTFKN